MSSHKSDRPVILMQPGPLHLFWTTGVFYIWALKKRFNLVLVVPEVYKGNTLFEKITSLQEVSRVEFLPEQKKFLRHFVWAKRFKAIILEFEPEKLLLHNESYVENQYLLYFAKNLIPNVPCFIYQNGKMTFYWKEDFIARNATRLELLLVKLPIFSHNIWIARRIIKLMNYLNYRINYQLLPLISLGSFFNPPLNVINGQFKNKSSEKMSKNNQKIFFAYLEVEIKAFKSHGINNIRKIIHPLKQNSKKVFKFLYGDFEETNTILILPSNSFTSRMIQDGWNQVDLIGHITMRWKEAINKLYEYYSNFQFMMKLHPASSEDPLWKEILKELQISCPYLDLIPHDQSAEWHIVRSKVIVGDVTSSLWWAGLYGGKTVLSLDLFGYHGGDDMKNYKGIVEYINNIEDLKKIKISKVQKFDYDSSSLITHFL